MLLVLGALATWRGIELGRRQRLDDEFVRAIELLTKTYEEEGTKQPLVAAHIGAMHTLERVMHAEAKNQAAIVVVLSAYVRQFSPVTELGDRQLEAKAPAQRVLGHRRPAVWWALDVLQRRPPRKDDPVVDLSGSDLRNSRIDLSALAPVNVAGTDLRGCIDRPFRSGPR